MAIDSGAPITVLTGVHAGCYELFAHEDIRGIADLKGKKVGTLGGQVLISMMAAYVGLDPKKDLTLGRRPRRQTDGPVRRRQARRVSGAPARSAGVARRKVGHVILRTTVDRPWSQYFCCMLAANREYATRYPVATKRVIRAVLKAADLCAGDPSRRRG